MKALLLRLLACIALAACSFLARADTVTVFAAASLKEALDAAAAPFQSATGHRVSVSYAASGALARQIEHGAPADLFISADADWIDYVERKGLVAAGTRRDLAANELVLIAPVSSAVQIKLARGVDLAAALPGKRIALANPDAVPAGKYAKAALIALGAWPAIEGKVAAVDNVRVALALVARGEAPLGIVYRTDALAARGVRIIDAFPAGSHAPIRYPMVRLRRGAAPAAALAAHLASAESLAIFARHGFRAP